MPEAIDLKVLLAHHRYSIAGLVTASDPSAPPILQWDRDDERNPVSWYVYFGRSTPFDWNLPESWVDVSVVSFSPALWTRNAPSQFANQALLILKGAHDRNYKSGLMLFPEILHTDLHPVRSTIESYSDQGRMQDPASGVAGLVIGKSGSQGCPIRTTTKTGTVDYVIDRWD